MKRGDARALGCKALIHDQRGRTYGFHPVSDPVDSLTRHVVTYRRDRLVLERPA